MSLAALQRPAHVPLSDRLGLTKREAAAAVPCSERFLEMEIKAKRLRACKIGRKVVIRPGDLSAWMDARTGTSEAD